MYTNSGSILKPEKKNKLNVILESSLADWNVRVRIFIYMAVYRSKRDNPFKECPSSPTSENFIALNIML